MKVRTLRKNSVNVITLGCSKNLVDSEELMGQLKLNRFQVSHDAEEPSEIVIINTCGFIESAKKESIDTILRYAEARKNGTIEKLYVTGCLSERYKPELQRDIPEVDAYFGTRELPAILKTLKADYKKELLGERLLSTPRHFAYFKISEGCDRPCSFCAIPLMRGKHISVPIDELVKRAEKLAANGTKELLVIAQDSTYYGIDLYGKRILADLLTALSQVDGIEWIRLHYAFPSGFPMDVLDVIRENSKICNYLDMPLQHVSDNVLKNMRRGTTRDKTTKLVEAIRAQVPGIALRTTLISGYPGETAAEHKELLAWVEAMRFDRLGVFTYSHEENTHAYLAKDSVSSAVKRKRAAEIMTLQQRISLELNEQRVGSVMPVLIDREENGYWIARSEYDSPEVDNEVLIEKEVAPTASPGQFLNVKITQAGEFDLFAVPC